MLTGIFRLISTPGQGVHIYLGFTGSHICPVSAVLSFLAVRPVGLSGPLLCAQNGEALTRACRVVRAALASKGVNPSRYLSHSFRIGAATAATQAGVPDHIIKMLGRWQSSAYLLYIYSDPRFSVGPLVGPHHLPIRLGPHE